jgi:hypothetical protein
MRLFLAGGGCVAAAAASVAACMPPPLLPDLLPRAGVGLAGLGATTFLVRAAGARLGSGSSYSSSSS